MIVHSHEPPSDRRANLAAALAPLAALAAFALVALDVVSFDTAVIVFLACAAWVVYEMHRCQREIDEYTLRDVQSLPPWRDADALDTRAPELLTEVSQL